MRSYLTCRTLTTALSGIILGGLALSGAAYAISSAAFRYATPQTGYLTIPAAAFTPENTTSVYTNSGFALGPTGIACFTAPVNLPHGAKITQLAMWYIKSDATQVFLQLLRYPVDDYFSSMTIAVLEAVNSGGVMKQATANITEPSKQIVNNASYAYVVGQCLSDTQAFSSARIKYTYKTAGD